MKLEKLVARLVTEETRLGINITPTDASEALVAKGAHHKNHKPKRKAKCNYCGIPGHWERKCRVKTRDLRESGRNENPRIRKANALINIMLHAATEGDEIQDKWCLDSGATSHMTGKKNWFTDLVSLPTKIPIRIGGRKLIYAVAKGNINILACNGKDWVHKY